MDWTGLDMIFPVDEGVAEQLPASRETKCHLAVMSVAAIGLRRMTVEITRSSVADEKPSVTALW